MSRSGSVEATAEATVEATSEATAEVIFMYSYFLISVFIPEVN